MSSPQDTPPSAPQPAEPGPSSRIALEVALLADTESATGPAPPSPAGSVRATIAITDGDLRAYVRDCLRTRVDIRVVDNFDADFMVSERVPRDLAIPLLLLADDQNVSPDLLHSGSSMSPRVEVLFAPFNARRLLEAVDRLLRDGHSERSAGGA